MISDLYGKIISEEFDFLDQWGDTVFTGIDTDQNGVRVFVDEETGEITVTDYNLEKDVSDRGADVFYPVTEFFTAVKDGDMEKIAAILDRERYEEISALMKTQDKNANPENLRGNELAAWLILHREELNGVPLKAHEWLYIGTEEGLYSQFDFYIGAGGEKYLMLITGCVVSEGDGKYKFCWIY